MALAAGVAATCMSDKGLNRAEGCAELQVDMDAGDCMSARPCCCCCSSGVVSLLHVHQKQHLKLNQLPSFPGQCPCYLLIEEHKVPSCLQGLYGYK